MKLCVLTIIFCCIFGAVHCQDCDGRARRSETKPTCAEHKENSTCLPIVTGTKIPWDEVSETSFIARWTPVRSANCYFVQVLLGYTILIVKNYTCHKSSVIQITNVEPGRNYGIQVSVVDMNCEYGAWGKPARTKTSGIRIETTRKPAPTYTPEAKQCGKRFFTCHSDPSECVPNRKWCNRVLNCVDGSDERNCPKGCKELDLEFNNGNYSCSRWGSPGSVCRFECSKPYQLDGNYLTQCNRKTRSWRKPFPVCRLSFTRILKTVIDESTSNSLTVEWERVEGAASYFFIAEEITGEKNKQMKKMKIDASECCKTTIRGLKSDSEFEITMKALDDSDFEGMISLPTYGHTVTESDIKAGLEEEGIDKS